MYKVLLVEDELVILSGLKKLIEGVAGGYVVCGEARNGKEAIARMKEQLPDVIVTDIRMKEMDGLEMIERIRKQHPTLPILIISGHDDFEYVKNALRNKVADYLLKPVDRIELAQSLGKVKHELDRQRGVARDEAQQEAGERPLIRQIKQLVQERLDQEISLQYVAEHVHLNHQYLSTLFKTETGSNFMEYVTEQRIERAKALLRDTRLKIYEVARLSGYANAKHFMVMFKQAVGMTASEYRDSAGDHKQLNNSN
jgi:two-component system response regulator YesN